MDRIQQKAEFDRMFEEALKTAGFLERRGLAAAREKIWKLFEKHTATTYQKAYCSGNAR